MNPEQITAAQVAIEETRSPRLGVTQQIVSSHNLIIRDGVPQIARVDDSVEAGAFYVYFPLINEPYYFVVVVRPENEQLTPSASYIESCVNVYLLILSKHLSPNEISSKVGIQPTEVKHMGEQIMIYRSDGKSPIAATKKYKQHHWEYNPQKDIPDELERKLIFLLDRIEPSREAIASLLNIADIGIQVCYKGYKDWMGGWHLDSGIIRRIAALGADLDFDFYASGPDLPE